MFKPHQRWKFTIGLTGILLTLLGWHLNHFDKYAWAVKFLAPNYGQVIKAYENLLTRGASAKLRGSATIKSGDAGFSELLSILSNVIQEFPDRQSVVGISISDVGLAIGSYTLETSAYYSGIQPHFEIALKDGRILRRYTDDLRVDIRKRFLEAPLFFWGRMIFWAGITLSIVRLFIP